MATRLFLRSITTLTPLRNTSMPPTFWPKRAIEGAELRLVHGLEAGAGDVLAWSAGTDRRTSAGAHARPAPGGGWPGCWSAPRLDSFQRTVGRPSRSSMSSTRAPRAWSCASVAGEALGVGAREERVVIDALLGHRRSSPRGAPATDWSTAFPSSACVFLLGLLVGELPTATALREGTLRGGRSALRISSAERYDEGAREAAGPRGRGLWAQLSTISSKRCAPRHEPEAVSVDCRESAWGRMLTRRRKRWKGPPQQL